MKFTLLVFTLNEIEGMKEIMPKIKRDWVDEILIVDGGSTDGTIDYARENGYPTYIQKKKGLRHAYIEALDVVSSDYIIAFSPDGNSIPSLIPELRQKAEQGYDMVVCSRYLEDAKSFDDDAITSFGNWLFTKSINWLHGSKYTDAMVMFRAVNRKVFSTLDLDMDRSYQIPEKIFSTNICLIPLMSVRAARKKLRTAEIPGDEPVRIGGERKMKIIKWGMAYFFQIIYEFLYRFEKRTK